MHARSCLVFAFLLNPMLVQGENSDLKTDRGIYQAGRAPVLPKAGGVFIDPTFGGRVMRVTDESDARNSANAYSYWPSFNMDSTRFHIMCGEKAMLYRFDPDAFKIVGSEPLFARNPIGDVPRWEDCIWSGVHEDIIFGHTETKLWEYNIREQKYTLVKEFSGFLPSRGLIQQMSKSLDDKVFSFSIDSKPGQHVGYIVWERSKDRVLLKKILSGTIDEVQVDKSGEFLVIKTGRQGKGTIEVQIANLATGEIKDLTDDPPDSAPGHSDNGYGTVVGADNWENRITYRNLAKPHQPRTILELKNDWSQDYHLSMLANDEEWCLVSFYTEAGSKLVSSGLFLNEIVQVATDGSGRIRRLAHHRSVVKEYCDSPRANISRDGRFVIFTSNWMGRGQRDVFILRVPFPKGNERTILQN